VAQLGQYHCEGSAEPRLPHHPFAVARVQGYVESGIATFEFNLSFSLDDRFAISPFLLFFFALVAHNDWESLLVAPIQR